MPEREPQWRGRTLLGFLLGWGESKRRCIARNASLNPRSGRSGNTGAEGPSTMKKPFSRCIPCALNITQTHLDLVPPGGPGLREAVQQQHERLAAAQAMRGSVQPAPLQQGRERDRLGMAAATRKERTVWVQPTGQVGQDRTSSRGIQQPEEVAGHTQQLATLHASSRAADEPHLTPALSTYMCFMSGIGSGKACLLRSTFLK